MTNKIDCDAIVVGAGFAGLALIHHLKKTGISVKVLDKASEIGGTWAWNRYPGAATDSEGSVSYTHLTLPTKLHV